MVQGDQFKDKEWTEDTAFQRVLEGLDVILAIVDTRHPETGFVCYYRNENAKVRTKFENDGDLQDKPIIKIAYNGNNYMSVLEHPELDQGALSVSDTKSSKAMNNH